MIKSPYTYQKKIVAKVLKQWGLPYQDIEGISELEEGKQEQSQSEIEIKNNYGAIIFIETGAGKSYISLMIIKSFFNERHDRLEELTEDKIKEKRMNSSGLLLYDENEAR